MLEIDVDEIHPPRLSLAAIPDAVHSARRTDAAIRYLDVKASEFAWELEPKSPLCWFDVAGSSRSEWQAACFSPSDQSRDDFIGPVRAHGRIVVSARGQRSASAGTGDRQVARLSHPSDTFVDTFACDHERWPVAPRGSNLRSSERTRY